MTNQMTRASNQTVNKASEHAVIVDQQASTEPNGSIVCLCGNVLCGEQGVCPESMNTRSNTRSPMQIPLLWGHHNDYITNACTINHKKTRGCGDSEPLESQKN